MRKLLPAIIICLLCSLGIHAQDFRTGFFLKNYLYDYRLNPACHGDSYNGFVSFGIGDVTVGLQSNFPLAPFIFKDSQGSYTIGLAEGYSMDKLRKRMPNFGKVNICINENLASFGWVKRNSAGSFEVNLRSNSSAYIDYETAKIFMDGLSGVPYSCENQKVNSRNWLEVAYGFGRSLSSSFSVGARIKGLIGLNYSDFNSSYLGLDQNHDDIYTFVRDSEGSFRSSNDVLNFKSTDGIIHPVPQLGHYGIGGIGAAVDLGMKIITDRDLEISVSILDLGGLLWKNKIYGELRNMVIGTIPEVFDLVEAKPEKGSSFVLNPISVEAGVIYPINDVISAGTLATIRIDETARGWYELRVGGAFSPSRVFSVAASAGMNTLGAGIGAALNLRLPGIALFIGTDSLLPLFSLNSDFIPRMKINSAVNAGLSIAW